jgi:uncharacterized protein with FMN-binding domain
MKVLKLIGKILIAFLIIMVIIFIAASIFLNRGKDEVLATKINDINLSNVNDGKYTGSFNGYRWSNTVEVTVSNKKITNITFIKGQTFRVADIENKLIKEVIDNQSTKVDTISGATISSRAILKAIENAVNR